MKRIDIFKELWHHRSLAEKRSPIYSQNKAAKFIVGILSIFIVGYLMFLAILFSLIANDSRSTTTIEFILSLLPVILSLDFLFRWMMQQTPSQIITPYLLLPLPRYVCIDAFIIKSIINWGNTIWLFFLIPYCIMSVLFSHGIAECIYILFTYLLLIFANSQWYAIVRVLVLNRLSWWLLPVAVYGIIYSPLFINGIPTEKSIDIFLDFYSNIGTLIGNGSLLPISVALLLLCILIMVNRKIQFANIMTELGKLNKIQKINKVSDFRFLNRYGEVGEYLKLEIKSMMRNKNLRKSFITATFVVITLSLICSYSNIYDDSSMITFWCLYNLVVYAAMLLVKIMCYEGNYIDALLIHKENILSLLKAKYIFFCGLLFFPLLLLTPTIISGKWTISMIISYSLFTAGFQYFVIFQLAVYNKSTIPLNTKFTSKNGLENNYLQLLASTCIFIIPMALISLLKSLFSATTATIIIATIGIVFIATNNFWLRNIYIRMMKRKYQNLEGFRLSR